MKILKAFILEGANGGTLTITETKNRAAVEVAILEANGMNGKILLDSDAFYELCQLNYKIDVRTKAETAFEKDLEVADSSPGYASPVNNEACGKRQ